MPATSSGWGRFLALTAEYAMVATSSMKVRSVPSTAGVAYSVSKRVIWGCCNFVCFETASEVEIDTRETFETPAAEPLNVEGGAELRFDLNLNREPDFAGGGSRDEPDFN